MSNIDVKSMFESIKDSLKKEKETSNSFKDILKLVTGNSYIVRLIPNIKDPKETIFHYYHHGWTSNETGQYIDAICPTTWGERCIICEERFKLWKTGDEKNKALASLIRRLEKHYVNVYVINDPVEDKNNNTVKILRMGIRLYEKVQSAIEGDDADEFGSRVFDLTEAGCNLKIKVESSQDGNKKFTNYNNSRFTTSSAIPGMTSEKIQEIYENIYNLPNYVERKTTDDLKEMLRIHVFGDKKTAVVNPTTVETAVKEATTVTKNNTSVVEKETKSTKAKNEKTSNDDKIKELLNGLD